MLGTGDIHRFAGPGNPTWMEELLWKIWTIRIKASVILSERETRALGKAKIQTIENRASRGTLDNRVSST